MKSFIIFEEIAADVEQISQEFRIDCGQDMRWLAQFRLTGSNGNPKICVEEAINHEGQKIWTSIPNYLEDDGLYTMDKTIIGIRDSYFMGSIIRFRFLPEDNTSGTIYAQLIQKTKV